MEGKTPIQQGRIHKGVTSLPIVAGSTLFAKTAGVLRGQDEIDDARAVARPLLQRGSRPSMQVLQRLLREGKMPGRKVGGAWYIDEHEWLANGDDPVLSVLRSS